MTDKYELRHRFNHGTLKIHRDDADRGHKTYQANLPQNGTDGFSLTFWTNDPIDEMTLTVDDPVSPGGGKLSATVFKMAYIPVRNRPMPDAMMEAVDTFEVSRGNAQSFYIRLSAPKGAAPGVYKGAFRVEKDGEVIKSAAFSASVWGFALPDVPACGTLFGLSKAQIQTRHEVDDAKADELYKKYFEFLLENKICVKDLPYDLLDPRADAYLDDPRVKHFRIPYSKDDATILAYREKLSSNPEWLKKGLFYPVDEPSAPDRLEHYRAVTERLNRLWPDFQMITPLGDSRLFPEGYDNISFLAPYQSHWCLRSDMFGAAGTAGYVKDEFADPDKDLAQTFGTVLTRMDEERAGGDKIWWYVCGFPYLMSYCDLNLDNTGAQHRVLFWQQFAYGVEGLLYWSLNYWGSDGSPWDDPFNFDKIHHADGALLYNGNEIGVDGPVSSLRIEMIRAGVDDFELLTMAKKLLSKAELDAIVNPIVNPSPSFNEALYGDAGRDIFTFCESDDAFYEARARLGRAVEAAQKR